MREGKQSALRILVEKLQVCTAAPNAAGIRHAVATPLETQHGFFECFGPSKPAPFSCSLLRKVFDLPFTLFNARQFLGVAQSAAVETPGRRYRDVHRLAIQIVIPAMSEYVAEFGIATITMIERARHDIGLVSVI